MNTRQVMSYTRVAILFGLAIYFAYNIVTGNLANYVNNRFAWLSYVAVLIFLALGAASAYALWRNHGSNYGQDDYTRQDITWSILAVAAIPLLLGFGVPSRPLGAEAVNGNISLTVSSVETAVINANTKAPNERNVLDWLRVFSQSATPSTFDGETADVIGFIYREPSFPEDTFMVSRFTVSCCVADAGAIGLPVYWPDADDLNDGEWVRVSGDLRAEVFRDTKMPVIRALVVEIVEEPEHPYLYP